MDQRVKSLLVLGGGSAGFLAAITAKFRLPELPVTVLRSKDIGIIGVGEGTTLTLPQHLHDYMKLDIKDFYRVADPQWKLGIRFLWGKRPYFDYAFSHQLDTKYNLLSRMTGYYCNGDWTYVGIPSGLMSHNRIMVRDPLGRPVVTNDLAYHIENEKFVTWLEAHARQLGVAIQDDTVEEVLQDEHGVTGLRLASGQTATADLFVDCSGFFSVLLGKALNEPFISYKSSLFNDRAVVGGWTRTDEPIKPYTTAETMNAGWCWQIEHETRINRGYVYSSDFISDEEADAEFRAKTRRLTRRASSNSAPGGMSAPGSRMLWQSATRRDLSSLWRRLHSVQLPGNANLSPRRWLSVIGKCIPRCDDSLIDETPRAGTKSAAFSPCTSSSTSGSKHATGKPVKTTPSCRTRRSLWLITANWAPAFSTARRFSTRPTSLEWKGIFRCWWASKCRTSISSSHRLRSGLTGKEFNKRLKTR